MLRRGRCGLARPPRRRRVDGSLIRNSESASRVTSRDSRRDAGAAAIKFTSHGPPGTPPPRHRRGACSMAPYTGFRIWVSLVVTKLYSLLMKIGEHRAKEVDDHHNYDAKCACMP